MSALSYGELSRRLSKLTQERLQAEVTEIIIDDDKIISRKKDEFKAGVKPTGDIIGRYASEGYRLFKMELNPLAGGNVDLRLTGATERSLEVVEESPGKYYIKANTDYWPALVEKYGDDIRTINRLIFQTLQKFTYGPELIKRMKSISGIR